MRGKKRETDTQILNAGLPNSFLQVRNVLQ